MRNAKYNSLIELNPIAYLVMKVDKLLIKNSITLEKTLVKSCLTTPQWRYMN